MLAKIAGALLVLAGIYLGFKSAGAVVGGLIGLVVMAALTVGILVALYAGWRLINGHSTVAKIVGAFLFVVAVLAAFPAALTMVAGTLAAVILVIKILFIALLLHVGLRWLRTGRFRADRGW